MCNGCGKGATSPAAVPAAFAAPSRIGVTSIPSPTGVGSLYVPTYVPQPLPGVTVTAAPDRLPWWLLVGGIVGALVLLDAK